MMETDLQKLTNQVLALADSGVSNLVHFGDFKISVYFNGRRLMVYSSAKDSQMHLVDWRLGWSLDEHSYTRERAIKALIRDTQTAIALHAVSTLE